MKTLILGVYFYFFSMHWLIKRFSSSCSCAHRTFKTPPTCQIQINRQHSSCHQPSFWRALIFWRHSSAFCAGGLKPAAMKTRWKKQTAGLERIWVCASWSLFLHCAIILILIISRAPTRLHTKDTFKTFTKNRTKKENVALIGTKTKIFHHV